MMKKMRVVVSSEEGFSLVEILAAIVLLAMLVGPFLTMFVQSAKNNQVTQNIDDATFVANTQMDAFYQFVSTSSSVTQLVSNLSSNGNYTEDYPSSNKPVYCSDDAELCYHRGPDNMVKAHFVVIELKKVDQTTTYDLPLEDVYVKVYQSEKQAKADIYQQQAQMESVFTWGN